jgi:hypothetical protein
MATAITDQERELNETELFHSITYDRLRVVGDPSTPRSNEEVDKLIASHKSGDPLYAIAPFTQALESHTRNDENRKALRRSIDAVNTAKTAADALQAHTELATANAAALAAQTTVELSEKLRASENRAGELIIAATRAAANANGNPGYVAQDLATQYTDPNAYKNKNGEVNLSLAGQATRTHTTYNSFETGLFKEIADLKTSSAYNFLVKNQTVDAAARTLMDAIDHIEKTSGVFRTRLIDTAKHIFLASKEGGWPSADAVMGVGDHSFANKDEHEQYKAVGKTEVAEASARATAVNLIARDNKCKSADEGHARGDAYARVAGSFNYDRIGRGDNRGDNRERDGRDNRRGGSGSKPGYNASPNKFTYKR